MGPVGSPPHAWGQRGPLSFAAMPTRFTPTCVGTANSLSTGSFRSTVHPHMRGDSPSGDAFHDIIDGSPPHAWGQRKRSVK